ncbi:MAG TPA: integrase family protein, partial [Rhizomicrobium sp.]
MRLTDMSIRALETPQKGAVIFGDDLVPGFGVRVSEGGTKSFVLTHGVRRQRETIGRVGILSLQEARGEAKRRLAAYTLGKERLKAVAWNSGLQTYLKEVERRCKYLTHSNYNYVLKRHFKYGETALDQISPHDITKSLDRLARTPAEQQRAYVVLRAFLRWAHRKHLIDKNPMERMQEPRAYRARERVLTNDELRIVWRNAGDDTFGHIVKLLILTGQRRGEITNLTPEMLRGDRLTLPSWLTKNSREHTIPIGSVAQTLLP